MFQIQGDLVLKGLVSNIVKFNGEVTALFNKKSFCPEKYEEHYTIGNQSKDKQAVYDINNLIMITKDRQVSIEPYTQDPLSAIFFIGAHKFEKGKKVNVAINPGKSNYRLTAEVVGIENIIINKEQSKVWKLQGSIVKIKDKNKKIADVIIWYDFGDSKKLVKIEVATKAGTILVERDN